MSNAQQFDLTGKVAFITGAGHGIGRACAVALAKAGAKVAILDLNVHGLQETAAMIDKESLVLEGDVTEELGIKDALEKVIKRFKKLDIAFCNAGTFQDIKAEEMPLEEFNRVIRVNLIGTFITARASGQRMILNRHGSIILTASMSGHIANIPQCQCAYNASKAGVIMLGKSLAIEWAKHNIRVNTISPGYIRTWSDEPLAPEEVGKSNFEQWTPMKRFGQADEITGLVQYLASDASSFVTGSDILIDGGYTAF